MDIGIGLPSTLPGATGAQVVEWAKRADAAGFASLGTIDRLVYPNYEPLVALGAAAAVTERARLVTAIAILPYRQNAALVAKQAASVQALSNGRLVLGVAVGVRPDDFEASGVPMEGRGKRIEEMLDEIKRLWAGEERGYAGGVGPDVSDNPPSIILGGQVDAASGGRPSTATAGSWAAALRSRSRPRASSSRPHSARPGAPRSRAPWRSPTSRSTTTPRRRRARRSATTTSSPPSTRTWWWRARPRARMRSASACACSRSRAATSCCCSRPHPPRSRSTSAAVVL